MKDYEEGFDTGAKYVLEYLAEIFEGVEDTDVWADFFGDGEKVND